MIYEHVEIEGRIEREFERYFGLVASKKDLDACTGTAKALNLRYERYDELRE